MARPKSGSPRDSTTTIGFEAKLWLTADTATRRSANRNRAATWRNLRGAQDHRSNNMDAAEYKHVVLGLIFLKYISDIYHLAPHGMAGFVSGKTICNPASSFQS